MPWTLDPSGTAPPRLDSTLAKQLVELALSQSATNMNPAGRFDDTLEPLQVVFPSHLEGLPDKDAHQLRDLRQLFEAERSSLEGELGVPLSLRDVPPRASGPTWLVGPARCTPEFNRLSIEPSTVPIARRLRPQRILVTDAPDAAGLFESLSLLRSLAWASEDHLEARPCGSIDQAFLLTAEEIAHTWPSFARRSISWMDVCIPYANALAASPHPLDVLQAMVARLEDAHTAVRSTARVIPPSFRARVTEGSLLLHEVPTDSPAWHAGAREGFRLSTFDAMLALQRIGATPHHRPFAVASRLLAGEPGQATELTAIGPGGERVSWTESYHPPAPESLVTWRAMPSGAGYLRIKQWPSSDRIDELIDAAFEDFRTAPGLIVDLRGNPGGAISVATRFRDRFLRQRTLLGSIQFTQPDGALLPPGDLWAEPSTSQRRWPSPVRFLTDGATYSASEDALLGLQGLEHVEVVGMPSGGGSGRARSIALLQGWRLTVSSCLTFDRTGRCIEGAGFEVDRLVPMAQRTHTAWEPELFAEADSGW